MNIVSVERTGQDRVAIKCEWVQLLGSLRTTGRTLSEVGYSALAMDISRNDLVRWALNPDFRKLTCAHL